MIISCLIQCHSLQSILKSLDQSPPCVIMCCVPKKDNLPSGGCLSLFRKTNDCWQTTAPEIPDKILEG